MANFTKEQLQNQVMAGLIRTGVPESVARTAAIQSVRHYTVGQKTDPIAFLESAKRFIKTAKHMPDRPAKKPQSGRGRR